MLGTINLYPGEPVMNRSNVANLLEPQPSLNAISLQNAVLCADCDVVSDSPHDICMVCGSRSLLNICRVLGGRVPNNRAKLLQQESLEVTRREVVLHFRSSHRGRRRVSV
jgi:hypothetical protein